MIICTGPAHPSLGLPLLQREYILHKNLIKCKILFYSTKDNIKPEV